MFFLALRVGARGHGEGVFLERPFQEDLSHVLAPSPESRAFKDKRVVGTKTKERSQESEKKAGRDLRNKSGKCGGYLRRSLPLLLRNPIHHSRQRPVAFRGQGHQRGIRLCENIILGMKFAETVLLQVRVEFNLIDHGLVFCDFEDALEVFDAEVGDADVFC